MVDFDTTLDVDGGISLDWSGLSQFRLAPAKELLLQDEAGQVWAITVTPDGQLQAAKVDFNPGDSPLTIGQCDAGDLYVKVFVAEEERLCGN